MDYANINYESEEYLQAVRAIAPDYEPLMVADWCEKNTRRFPDKEAIADMERSLTWEQVVDESDRLAAALSLSGFKKGDRVILGMLLGIDLFLLRVACEKTGLLYLVLALDLSPDRIQRAIKEVNFKAMISDDIEKYSGIPVQLVKLSILKERSQSLSKEEIKSLLAGLQGSSPFQPLEIRISSGTVGGFPHYSYIVPRVRGFTSYIRLRRAGITKEDTIAVFGKSFGVAHGSVYSGIPIVGAKALFLAKIFKTEERKASLEFAFKKGVTVISRNPFIDNLLADYLPGSSIRLIFNGKPRLDLELAKKLEAISKAKIINIYSTEFGGISGSCITDSQKVRLETEGTPLDGNEVRIVSREGNVLPLGEEGIIQVRGLHSQPVHIAEAEIQKRWASGWFDTQDWGCLDEEGHLELLGRMDHEGKLIGLGQSGRRGPRGIVN